MVADVQDADGDIGRVGGSTRFTMPIGRISSAEESGHARSGRYMEASGRPTWSWTQGVPGSRIVMETYPSRSLVSPSVSTVLVIFASVGADRAERTGRNDKVSRNVNEAQQTNSDLTPFGVPEGQLSCFSGRRSHLHNEETSCSLLRKIPAPRSIFLQARGFHGQTVGQRHRKTYDLGRL